MRDINSRARAPSSIPRARPHDPARRRVIRHHDARSVDRDRRCREIKSIHGCRREIEIEIATRDAHLSTSMLNVFSAIGAMIFGMNRWTRACRSDDARRDDGWDASRARGPFFSGPSVRKVVGFTSVYTTTLACDVRTRWRARSHSFRAVLSGKVRVTFQWVFVRIIVDS